MYYLCSENKDADQLRSYREADLRLCFCICKKTVFSRRGSNITLCNLEVPVDGGWTDWSEWPDYGECDCEVGQKNRTRSRTCTNPPPSNGGDDCGRGNVDDSNSGEVEYKDCEPEECGKYAYDMSFVTRTPVFRGFDYLHGCLSPSAQHRVVYRKMCRTYPVVLQEIRK